MKAKQKAEKNRKKAEDEIKLLRKAATDGSALKVKQQSQLEKAENDLKFLKKKLDDEEAGRKEAMDAAVKADKVPYCYRSIYLYLDLSRSRSLILLFLFLFLFLFIGQQRVERESDEVGRRIEKAGC